MQCSCGGSTDSHQVIRENVVVGEFERCKACGRITWKMIKHSLKVELGITRSQRLELEKDATAV